MPQRTHRLALVLAVVLAAIALSARPAAGSGGYSVTLTISSAQEGVVASWTNSEGPWDVVLVAGVEYTFSVSCSCSPHDKSLMGDWDGEWGVWGAGAAISATYTFPLSMAGYLHTAFGECYGAGYGSSYGIFGVVAPADLDIEGVDDEDEESAGAFVVRKLDDNAAPRRKIVLNETTPTSWDGHVLLSRSSDKVGVFDAETGGNEVTFNGTDNRFLASALPRQLWVEGHTRSDNLCDVGLTLALEGLPRTDDTVAFTVVESDLDIDSDNDNGTDAPERDSEEDENEDKQGDPEHPGKYLALNDGDDDGDGIPDFADGFDLDGVAGTDDDGSAGEAFVPLVLELPQFVDPAGLTVSFTYPASDPAGVTCGGSPPVYTLPASGGLRIWLKDGSQARNKNSVADPGEPGDYVPSGTFDAPLLGYSAGTRTITLYVEAVHPSAIGGDQRIAVEVTPQGEQAQWGPLGLDAVRCRGTRVQFVVPDAMDDDTGLPAPNAQPTDTTWLGVSDPRPIVALDDIQPGDVSISGGVATVTIRGTVRDPIADNTPRGKVSEGKADIDSVKIIVNGYDDGTTVSVEAQADGAATFFRRHPYKGQFGPVAVTFPATHGTHTISIETSENAAGRTGSDDIEIRLTTREVPGAEGEGGEGGALLLPNIYIPQDPAPETADSIQYYYGDRGPAQDDPTLSEDAGDEASLVFHGTVEDVQAVITMAGFGGLTPNADTLSGTVVYTWPTGEVLRFDVAFVETGAETKIFRGTLSLDPGPITVNQNVYVPVAPTPGTADTIRFFLGDRDPEGGDPAFSENPGEEDSLVFHGTYWGEPARITVTNFAGLTAAVDTLAAQVTLSPGAGNETSWQENLTETGAETNLFRVASVVEGGWNGGERAITAHYRVVIGQDFDPDAPDTVRFYIGEAEPPGGGTELTETGNGTKEFTATLADGTVVGVKVIQFVGLTPNVDDAVIRLTLTEPGHIPHAFEETYTETGAQTRTFNYTEPGDPDPPVSSPCVASVVNVNRKHGTFSQPMSVRVQGLSRTDGTSVRLFDQRDFSLKEHEDGDAYAALGDAITVGSLVHADEGYQFIYWDAAQQSLETVALGSAPALRRADLFKGAALLARRAASDSRIVFVGKDGSEVESLSPVAISVLLEHLEGEDYVPGDDAFAKLRLHGFKSDTTVTVTSEDLAADSFELLMPGASPSGARHVDLVDQGAYAESPHWICIYQPDDEHQQLTDAQWNALADRGILAVHNIGAVAGSGDIIKRPLALFHEHHLFNKFRKNSLYGAFWQEIFGGDFDVDDFCVRVPRVQHQRNVGAITRRWKGFIDDQRLRMANRVTTVRDVQRATMDEMLDIAEEYRYDVHKVKRYRSKAKAGSTVGKLFRQAEKAGKIGLGRAGRGARWKAILGKAARGLGKTVKAVLKATGYVFTALFIIKFAQDPAQACADEFGVSKETFNGWIQGRVVISLSIWPDGQQYVDSAEVSDGSIFTVGEWYWTTKQDPVSKLHYRDKYLETLKIRTTDIAGKVDITMGDGSAKGLTLEVVQSTKPVDLIEE